jgi:hypothetical protein
VRRLPWGRVLRVWFNWRWWPMVLGLALLGEVWPHTFFAADPVGSVKAQITRVALKLVAAYLLAVLCWVLALVSAAALLIGPTGRAVISPSTAPEPARLEGRPLPMGGVEDHPGGNA